MCTQQHQLSAAQTGHAVSVPLPTSPLLNLLRGPLNACTRSSTPHPCLRLTDLCCLPPCVPPPLQATPALLSPADAYMYVAKDGQKKAEMSVAKTFTMALYAGAYIAFGGFLGLAVVSNCPGERGGTTHSGTPLSARLSEWPHSVRPKCGCAGMSRLHRVCCHLQFCLEGGHERRAALAGESGLAHRLHTGHTAHHTRTFQASRRPAYLIL